MTPAYVGAGGQPSGEKIRLEGGRGRWGAPESGGSPRWQGPGGLLRRWWKRGLRWERQKGEFGFVRLHACEDVTSGFQLETRERATMT
ncbi:hypothetical protein Zmor_004835 [Zophobas morio]|uniref:Uncharacterized protein n=1 Tax=Zophobas morio TaxID=2755281 RepID=A0AA38IR58_9CUCU|nr:hypothetical protein Zmor_004835 [Zophobas morio]